MAKWLVEVARLPEIDKDVVQDVREIVHVNAALVLKATDYPDRHVRLVHLSVLTSRYTASRTVAGRDDVTQGDSAAR